MVMAVSARRKITKMIQRNGLEEIYEVSPVFGEPKHDKGYNQHN